MRIVVFLVIVMLGSLFGFVVSGDPIEARLVAACLGAIVGAAIGGAVTRLGSEPIDKRQIPGIGTKPRDLAANYWRDHGRPPR